MTGLRCRSPRWARSAWLLAVALSVTALLGPPAGAAQATDAGWPTDPVPATIVARIPVAPFPYELLVDGDTLWALSGGDQDTVLSRVDLRTNRVVATIRFDPPTSWGQGVMAIAGGDLWISKEYENVVVRVDRATNRVVGRVEVGTTPRGLLAYDGALWVATQNSRDVTKVDPVRGRVLARYPVGDPSLYSGGPTFVFTARGSLWATVPAMQAVQRLDARTGRVIRTLRVAPGIACSRPHQAGDVLWLVDRDCSESITGVDLDDGRVVGHVNLAETDPRGLLFGGTVADGALWTSEMRFPDQSLIVRRSVANGSPLASYRLPEDLGAPYAIRAYRGDLWTTSIDSLRRLRLR